MACGEPNVRFQQSLDEQPAGQTWVHERLSQAAEIIATVQDEFGIAPGETTADGKLSLATARCLGSCGLAPVMVVDRDVHGGVTPDSACEILEGYE